MTTMDSTGERTPAEILEEHGKKSVDRVIKIERWVKRVTYLTLGLVATTMITGVIVTLAYVYLLGQIQDSRYETAVKSCQVNRESTSQGLSNLMVSLSKTKEQEDRSRALAAEFFPSSRDDCEEYAKEIGLTP